MRILAIDRHYWPDQNPYSSILWMLATAWAAQGHEVTVYCAQPSYNDYRNPQASFEVLDGVRVHRVGLLPERKHLRLLWLINCLYFLARACCFAVRRRDFDVTLGSTSLPILNILALRLIRYLTSIPYIVHAQDIHPEAAACAGKLRRGLFYRWLKDWDVESHRQAKHIVAIGLDQRNTLIERGIDGERISIVHNPPLDPVLTAGGVTPISAEQADRDRFCVLFAGNLGHFQGLDMIVDAAHLLREHSDIKFVFLGDGTAKKGLQVRAGDLEGRTVFFVPRLSLDSTFATMCRANLGVVSLVPGMYRLAFPSKMPMYLSAGCPILAVVEPESGIAHMVKRQRLGIPVRELTAESVAEAILDARMQSLGTDPQERRRIQEFCQREFGRARMIREWDRILTQIAPVSSQRSRGEQLPRRHAA